jgi:hypothetical protein
MCGHFLFAIVHRGKANDIQPGIQWYTYVEFDTDLIAVG